MGRAPCCDKTKVKRGPWSPEEDNTLKTYLDNYGTGGNWIALPQKAGLTRCGKSCRLRWLNYLRPNIKHGGFTEEEDNTILTLYNSIGSRWSVIASQLPGRTDNDVKNYWNTKLKKKLLAAAAAAATSPSTTNSLFTSSANNFNLAPMGASSVETISNRTSNYPIDICPNNMFPYLPMHVAAQIPLPGLMEVPGNIENPYNSCGLLLSAPVFQEAVSSISPSFSLDNNASGSASWSSSNASGEDDTFLAEFVSGSMPYDTLNAFELEEKLTNQIDYHPKISYSFETVSNTEAQQQQPIIHESL